NYGAGIRLGPDVELSLVDCTVLGNRWGVVIGPEGCGTAGVPSGTISGDGNLVIANAEADLCPPYPGPPWPEHFLAGCRRAMPGDTCGG
ncbi:MAG: hypothetical protein GXO72_02140, partial [Caldiserica bacterium]|nr:hypothetical protein [Caldisericota bacterium]